MPVIAEPAIAFEGSSRQAVGVPLELDGRRSGKSLDWTCIRVGRGTRARSHPGRVLTRRDACLLRKAGEVDAATEMLLTTARQVSDDGVCRRITLMAGCGGVDAVVTAYALAGRFSAAEKC